MLQNNYTKLNHIKIYNLYKAMKLTRNIRLRKLHWAGLVVRM